MIGLGQKVRDKITGFEGIVPNVDKDGNIKKAEWFDEGRVAVIDFGVTAQDVRVEKPGGPQRDMPE